MECVKKGYRISTPTERYNDSFGRTKQPVAVDGVSYFPFKGCPGQVVDGGCHLFEGDYAVVDKI